MSSRGRRGRGRVGWGRNYQLAERAPDNAGEGQVGVWLKKDALGTSEGGRGPLFVGIDLCGGGAGDPPPRPRARTVDRARRGPGPQGRDARGDPRPEQPAAGRTPLSRSVKLNKEGICVFLTSAGYLIDS